VTSAFLVQVDSQLQPDPNEEAAALLRVLIYKIDNTSFGGDVPTVPQWSGPPRTIVRVEAILYASLAASLFTAFLTMLGKQWLNKYTSIDMRGSAIERSQNQRQKLDGFTTWYFDYVMESLPLMLQFALLLLSCALSLYLWGIDRTAASVVLGFTSFGVVFYTFIVVAGAASMSCPYQTPSAHILRHIWSVLHSASSSASITTNPWSIHIFGRSIEGIAALPFCILLLPLALLIAAYRLVRAVVRVLVRRAPGRLRGVRGLPPQTAVLDLQCILWILQTSLDKFVHLSTLKSLATMKTLADFNPTLVSACFDILADCVAVVNGELMIRQGSEELAEVSALCLLRTFTHLAIMDPTSSLLEDVRRRYTSTFPLRTNSTTFISRLNFVVIHHTFYSPRRRTQGENLPRIQWEDYKPPGDEQIVLARALAELAPLKYQIHHKVPRWILRFALHHLSQDPLPPTSAVVDCLSIVAIDLDCTLSNTTTLDERYVHI
jgi:hypothetical protein